MKQFMFVVLVAVMLSGCTTENPHLRDLYIAGGTVLGGSLGYGAAATPGAFGGAYVGNKAVKAALWNPGDDEVEVVEVVSSGYSGDGVYCDRTPKGLVAPPGPGMCNDPDSGGEISYEGLLRREQARIARAQSLRDYYGATANTPKGVKEEAAESPPRNMWSRDRDRKKKTETENDTETVCPTVKDYRSSEWVGFYRNSEEFDCLTGNYGQDSACLKNEALEFEKMQAACMNDYRKCSRHGTNFKEVAYCYRKLAQSP